ncbi:hypothetical protein OG535_07605 [Kitasatospora sp. NBC_00085]|uniref:Rv1733c family protein n=1 Tax=unclassified Kitasatospora TaxID=2633591 RepID=UPI003245BD3A
MSSTPRPARPGSLPRRVGRELRRALGARPAASARPLDGPFGRALDLPLDRPLDRSRSRARLAAALGVLLALVAAVAGALLGYQATTRAAAAARARLHPVDAVVQSVDRPGATTSARRTGGYQNLLTAEATWTAPDGQPRTGAIEVRRTTTAGSTVALWLDGAGTPTAPPMTRNGLIADAVCAGLAGFLAVATALGGALALRLRVLDRQADRAWEESWARHEPRWSGRTTSSPGGPQDE